MLVLADFAASLDKGNLQAIVIVGGLFIAVIAIVTSFIRGVLRTRAREQTKRELAAYVAEGTMRPEDAERIIRADQPKWEKA
jgi:TolB-like protein